MSATAPIKRRAQVDIVEGAQTSRTRRALLAVIAVTAVLAVWAALSGLGFVNHVLVPSPADVARAAAAALRDGSLAKNTAASLLRVVEGFGVAVLVAMPLGIAMGISSTTRGLLEPLIELLRPVPPIAFIPLAILWFGIGETSKVLIIFYMTVFLVLLNTMAGVSVAFQSVAHGAKLRRDALAAVRVGRAPRNDGCRPHGPRGDESLPAPLPAGRPSWPLKRRRPSIPRPTAPGASQCAMSSSATPARSSRSCAT